MHAGVDLVDRALLRRRVACCSTIARTLPSASRTMRPKPIGSSSAPSAAPARLRRDAGQRAQASAAAQRTVADGTSVTPSCGKPAARARTAWPVPRGGSCAHEARDRGAASALAHRVAAMADRRRDRARRRASRAASMHVREQRPAGQRMQHFRQRRAHALAQAGGQDRELKRGMRHGRCDRRTTARCGDCNDTGIVTGRCASGASAARAAERARTSRGVPSAFCVDAARAWRSSRYSTRRAASARPRPRSTSSPRSRSAGSGRWASTSTRRRTCRTSSASQPRLADDTIYSFFMRQRPLDEIAQITKSGVMLCPAHLELAKLDSLLGKGVNVVTRLRHALHAHALPPGRWSSTAARCSTCCRSMRSSPPTWCWCRCRPTILSLQGAQARSSAR